MSGNPFAPAFAIKIDGQSLAADIEKAVQSVTVIQEIDTTDQFSLTVANPYPEMPWTHGKDAELFKEGHTVSIAMGYAGDLRPMLTGEITSISPVFPESGLPILQVEGHSRLHRLQGTRSTRTFQNMTDKEIVEQVATALHLTPKVDATEGRYPYVIQYNQTDFAFLQERARAIGFELQVDDKTLYFRKGAESQAKVYVLEWGKSLRDFRPTLNLVHQVSEVVVRGYDPKTKAEIEGRAGAGDEAAAMGGQKTGATITRDAFGGKREEVRVDVPVTSKAEAEQRARALYNQKAMELVTGSGSAVGLPELRAGSVIELGGLGPRFSGPYYITRAEHSISDGGYSTSFQVKRNAVS